jgi:hypothetical protein
MASETVQDSRYDLLSEFEIDSFAEVGDLAGDI